MSNVYANYAQSVAFTPQFQPITGRESDMVANNAGGFGFILDDWERLNRFLIIGSEGGTYYVGEQKLTIENSAAAIRCIKADGPRAVEMAREINVNNRAPKTDQQLFVLALAMKHGDDATKRAVATAVPQMVRTGTHLLHFVAMLDSLGGWNRSKRRIIASWFTERGADQVAFQVLKYQNRDKWTQRDVLRLVHPKAPTEAHDATFAWVTGKLKDDNASLPAILRDHGVMLSMDGTQVERALWGINHGLPREALPTEVVNAPEVQRAMLADMPIHALIRNLGNLTASGVLSNIADSEIVANRLVDRNTLRRSRVHPFAILLAALVYRTGKGVRGSKTWVPVPSVLAALEDAYDLAFDNVTPTGKRILITIDTSGSMGTLYGITQIGIKPIEAAAAMAITLARLEPYAVVIEVDTELRRIVPVTKRTGISGIMHHAGGGTDMSIPMQWAMASGVIQGKVKNPDVFDAFVILTDNESWAGDMHTSQALAAYRQRVNPKAKLVCCAMTASHANIVDPQDPLQFGCAGLDANLPALVGDFIGR